MSWRRTNTITRPPPCLRKASADVGSPLAYLMKVGTSITTPTMPMMIDTRLSSGLADVFSVELAVVSIEDASCVCARTIPDVRVSIADATADLFS